MSNEITPEQYKVEVYKRNTAARYAEYEDAIAGLQTQIAMLQQENEALKGQDDAEATPNATELPPPPPASE